VRDDTQSKLLAGSQHEYQALLVAGLSHRFSSLLAGFAQGKLLANSHNDVSALNFRPWLTAIVHGIRPLSLVRQQCPVRDKRDTFSHVMMRFPRTHQLDLEVVVWVYRSELLAHVHLCLARRADFRRLIRAGSDKSDSGTVR